MGVTPLLTNSQERSYGTFLFINILMKAIVPFLDKFHNIKANLPTLLQEYYTVQDKLLDVSNHGNQVLVQKSFTYLNVMNGPMKKHNYHIRWKLQMILRKYLILIV